MPLLGGLAIYLAFVLAIVVSFRVPTTPRILAILAGATLLVLVGILDDRFAHLDTVVTDLARLMEGVVGTIPGMRRVLRTSSSVPFEPS